ncbi:AAA family ATPase [Methylocystis heyeri]|uniref:AAA family ATPase n=1 Tax=Methylocystis heyeri TaxID=391905 RepID=A0A6B8KBE3_9HYPH|nr:AAA family ATPase [Methylocystis heyeri]QGM45476.1 AAA family ATPase [Methylocystis heyeri]
MITRLAVSGYRSLRNAKFALTPLTLVTGANGSGKSSLYRALRLLADVAQGRIVQSIAAEGGLQSILWAGPETFSREVKAGAYPVEGLVRRKPIALKLGVSGPRYGYSIDLGMPSAPAVFALDPQIKLEALWLGETLGRSNLLAERRGPGVRLKNENGLWRQAATALNPFDSMATHCADQREGFELFQLRETMRGWRFYDQFRTDRDAPARRLQIGTYTPVLASDGSDLAAALQTIATIGDGEALDASVADAFPGASVVCRESDGHVEVEMHQHGLLRPLRSPELSDGTLRYLLLLAALLTPRPPQLMILNEPEASLHPDLIAPLARLVMAASKRTGLIVVSHSRKLVDACLDTPGASEIRLEKQFGETLAPDAQAPKWVWPSR